MYTNKPLALDALKDVIHVDVTQIDTALLENVELIFKEHLQKCINENEHHMMDVVFFHAIFKNC